MCIAPINVNEHTVACRECWQCVENKIKQWAGRCTAEVLSSRKAITIELTYGEDENGEKNHPASTILTYSHVQKFLKQLRNNYKKIRYVVVGEYGSLKARAHWHCIIYFQETVPEWATTQKRKNKHIQEWPHGFVFVQDMSLKGAKYVLKYISKDRNNVKSVSKFMMSKKPPIGANFIKTYVEKYVDQSLPFNSKEYVLYDENGKRDIYYMTDALLDVACNWYLHYFLHKKGHDNYPESEIINDYLDRQYNLKSIIEFETNQQKQKRVDEWVRKNLSTEGHLRLIRKRELRAIAKHKRLYQQKAIKEGYCPF